MLSCDPENSAPRITVSKPMTNYDDTRYFEFVRNVLQEAADNFEKEQKFPDNILLSLYNVFGKVLERALELYEQDRVTHILISDGTAAGPSRDKKDERYLVQVKGISTALYILFPDVNYCTCASFRDQVLESRCILTCKHVLAAWFPTNTMHAATETYMLIAKLGSLRAVVQLLKAVNFKESATCFATENGLKVTVEDAKCVQASAYLPTHVFQEFNLKEDVVFKINLSILVECLCMFWSNINAHLGSVGLQLFYKGVGHPVTVLIEEDGVITDCSLKTQEPDQLLNFCLDPENVQNKVILQTELLKDILSELDPTSDLIELVLSPSSPYFRISTAGLAGICHIELPHDGDLVDSFHCTETATSSYKLAHIKPAMKALQYANKVSLRTDTFGLLCFQYMVKTEDGRTCYLEYYISPALDPDAES